MTWVWLSFADPDKPKGTQFLGVAIVEGEDVVDGAAEAHRLGINPGGEVLGYPLPDGLVVHEDFRNRLLDSLEAKELAGVIDHALRGTVH